MPTIDIYSPNPASSGTTLHGGTVVGAPNTGPSANNNYFPEAAEPNFPSLASQEEKYRNRWDDYLYYDS